MESIHSEISTVNKMWINQIRTRLFFLSEAERAEELLGERQNHSGVGGDPDVIGVRGS